MRIRAQDLILLLAVATAAAIYLALGNTRTTSPPSDTVGEAGVTQSSGTSPVDDAETTGSGTEPADASDATYDSESTDSAEPAQQDAARTSEGPSSAQVLVAQILAADDDEAVDVVVLGDDTSNLRSEWVHLWGQELSATREVTVVHWSEMIDIQYAEPDVLSQTGEGGALTIWSGSRAGADIESVTQRLGLFLEPEPDLVLLSLGANNDDADEAVQQMQSLVDELQGRLADTPVALVRQGAGGASDEVDQALSDWADGQGLFVIDARTAASAQEWAELVLAQTSEPA